jgi:hypothetical protein
MLKPGKHHIQKNVIKRNQILTVILNSLYCIIMKALILFVLIQSVAFGQKEPECQILAHSACVLTTPGIRIQSSDAAVIERLVRGEIPYLFKDHSGIAWQYTRNSPGGSHYAWQQTWHGIPVYGTEVKVNISGGVVSSLLNSSVETHSWKLNPADSPQINTGILPDGKELTAKVLMVYTQEQQDPQLVYCLTTTGPHGATDEYLVGINGLLQTRDLNYYVKPPDSTVSAFVFLPDPLTTAGKTYGGTYKDRSDSDATWLTTERKQVQMKADFTGGFFSLKNQYIYLSDFDVPNNSPAYASTPLFSFTRSQTGFEDVNAYYHISTFRDYVASLGFGCGDSLINIDPHALNGQDNSFFAYNYKPMRLYFGTGGVDDAEDADVCVHEYSHFLSYNAAPMSNSGTERQALDEAFCDYNAASYSRALNAYNWGFVYNWDGHNEYWTGRVVNSAKVYPADLQGNIYRDAPIWSSMLMELWSDLGKTTMDKLIFQTHYTYSQNISMLQAAQLLINADIALNNGSNYCIIAKRLSDRGLLPSGKTLCAVGIEEATTLPVEMRATPQQATIVASQNIRDAHIEVVNMVGQKVYSAAFSNTTELKAQDFTNGLYLICISTPKAKKVFRWVCAQ